LIVVQFADFSADFGYYFHLIWSWVNK